MPETKYELFPLRDGEMAELLKRLTVNLRRPTDFVFGIGWVALKQPLDQPLIPEIEFVLTLRGILLENGAGI